MPVIGCSPKPLLEYGAKINIFIPSTLIFLIVHHIGRPTLSLWAKCMKRSWGISLKLQNNGLWLKEFAVSGFMSFRPKLQATLWLFSIQFSYRLLNIQRVCQFSPILTMMFVRFLQLTLRSRWQAPHLPSIVKTRGRALVQARVWRTAHSGKGRQSPSRERTLILLAQTLDHDQAPWVQWIHLISCRKAEENLKRSLYFVDTQCFLGEFDDMMKELSPNVEKV